MSKFSSPYKEVGTNASKVLGWENTSRKDPKKTKKVPLEKRIYKILKSYVWDNYNRERYYQNCCRALIKLWEEKE